MGLNFPTGMLFRDPRTNQRLAGAQLFFYFSGTTSFISVYNDAALTSVATQPIVADANGNFQPIFLDPFASAGRCKVQLVSSQPTRIVDPYYIPFPISTDSSCIRYHTSTAQEVTIPAPASGTVALVVSNIPGAVAIRMIGGNSTIGGVPKPAWVVGNLTTGALVANFAPVANKPGPTSTTPAKWLPVGFGGVTYYLPCFL